MNGIEVLLLLLKRADNLHACSHGAKAFVPVGSEKVIYLTAIISGAKGRDYNQNQSGT